MEAVESPEALLQARGIRKEFFRKGRDSARYFDAVPTSDFNLHVGELVVLMGRSGSGKTTLLNMLAGLLEPTEGRVLFQGSDLYALPDAGLSRLRNRCFGIIPQGHTPVHSLNVLQNVLLPYALYRPAAEAEPRAIELLERMGIAELANAFPRELSGGELRRMAIARALVCEPDVIFADEPTGDLDDENTALVLDLLRQTANDGAAVLLVTHETAARPLADRTREFGS